MTVVLGFGKNSGMSKAEEMEERKTVAILEPSLSSYVFYKGTYWGVDEQFLVMSVNYFVLETVTRIRDSSGIRTIHLFLPACYIFAYLVRLYQFHQAGMQI